MYGIPLLCCLPNNVSIYGRTTPPVSPQLHKNMTVETWMGPHIPRPRRHRDAPVALGNSVLLPVDHDSEHALVHLKVLVLPEVDVQRRAGLALADALVADVMRLADGGEAGRVVDKVVHDRVLGREDGGVVGRGRALRRAGRQPLLEPAWRHLLCCWC